MTYIMHAWGLAMILLVLNAITLGYIEKERHRGGEKNRLKNSLLCVALSSKSAQTFWNSIIYLCIPSNGHGGLVTRLVCTARVVGVPGPCTQPLGKTVAALLDSAVRDGLALNSAPQFSVPGKWSRAALPALHHKSRLGPWVAPLASAVSVGVQAAPAVLQRPSLSGWNIRVWLPPCRGRIFPSQGSRNTSPCSEGRSLTAGPPEKSQVKCSEQPARCRLRFSLTQRLLAFAPHSYMSPFPHHFPLPGIHVAPRPGYRCDCWCSWSTGGNLRRDAVEAEMGIRSPWMRSSGGRGHWHPGCRNLYEFSYMGTCSTTAIIFSNLCYSLCLG